MSEPILIDFVSNARVVIDSPPESVWPHLLRQELWMKEVSIEHVEGRPGEVGELRRVQPIVPEGATVGLPVKEIQPFLFRTVKVSPLRTFAYKAYTGKRSEYGFSGIEILQLKDMDGATAVTLDVVLEFQSLQLRRDVFEGFVGTIRHGTDAMWARNFKHLRDLSERAG